MNGLTKNKWISILEHSVTQEKKPHAILLTEHHLDFEEGKTPSYMRKCKVNGKWEKWELHFIRGPLKKDK